jgi:serine protease Do
MAHRFSRFILPRLILSIPVAFCASTCTGEAPKNSMRRTPIVEAVQNAIPAVVNIHGQKTIEPSAATGDSGRRVNGMGTGIVIDQRGYILTNYHVIEGVRPIHVTLHDEQSFTATLVARDPYTDLAIIKISTAERLPLLKIGTSRDLMPGEPVIAIGNAYGYHHTVTRGIISSLNRSVEVTDSQRYVDLIQTDASINPGNSGGPLLNVDGEMIGINVAVRVGADGIAFAIPVDRAMDVAASLLAAEQTSRVWHGLKGTGVVDQGEWSYVVEEVAAGSPADKCGVRAGDRIIGVGNSTIQRQLDVERAFLGVPSDSEVTIKLLRNDREVPIRLVVRSLPESVRPSVMAPTTWARLGLRMEPVTQQEVPELANNYNGGLRVNAVREDSPAARNGIKVGDILVGMLEWETASLADLDYILAHIDPQGRTSIPFYVVRNRETRVGHLTLR